MSPEKRSGYTPDIMRSKSPGRTQSRPFIGQEDDSYHITFHSRRVQPSRLRRIIKNEDGRLPKLAQRCYPFSIHNKGGSWTESITSPARQSLQQDRGNRLSFHQPVVLLRYEGEVITDLEGHDLQLQLCSLRLQANDRGRR